MTKTTTTTTAKKKKRRHINWFNVFWALSQFVGIQFLIGLGKGLVGMLNTDYAPSEKAVLIMSLEFIFWLVMNQRSEPLDYLREWLWNYNQSHSEDENRDA